VPVPVGVLLVVVGWVVVWVPVLGGVTGAGFEWVGVGAGGGVGLVVVVSDAPPLVEVALAVVAWWWTVLWCALCFFLAGSAFLVVVVGVVAAALVVLECEAAVPPQPAIATAIPIVNTDLFVTCIPPRPAPGPRVQEVPDLTRVGGERSAGAGETTAVEREKNAARPTGAPRVSAVGRDATIPRSYWEQTAPGECYEDRG